VDAKRRFTVPSEWRGLLKPAGEVFVMPDPKGCLSLLSTAEMELRLKKLLDRPLVELAKDGTDEALRTLAENSEVLKLDTQGRIRICDRLLGFAGITDKAVLTSSLNRMEVWSPELMPEEEAVDKGKMAAALSKLQI
jgi:division/cell wall cluster transcriptional repressor MraZ